MSLTQHCCACAACLHSEMLRRDVHDASDEFVENKTRFLSWHSQILCEWFYDSIRDSCPRFIRDFQGFWVDLGIIFGNGIWDWVLRNLAMAKGAGILPAPLCHTIPPNIQLPSYPNLNPPEGRGPENIILMELVGLAWGSIY